MTPSSCFQGCKLYLKSFISKKKENPNFSPSHLFLRLYFPKVPWNFFPFNLQFFEKGHKYLVWYDKDDDGPTFPSNLHRRSFPAPDFREDEGLLPSLRRERKSIIKKMVKNASFLSMSRTNMLNQGSSTASSLPQQQHQRQHPSFFKWPLLGPPGYPLLLSSSAPPLKMIFWWGSLAYNQSIILLGKYKKGIHPFLRSVCICIVSPRLAGTT